MPLNILLADDSVPAQNMGKKILIDAGYHVQAVSNGLEALRRIADFIPDIVILDIFMPGYTGLELCERLRASDDTAALPVILTVGRLEPYRPEDGEHVHANAVIVKPFAAAELIAAVRSLIGAPAPDAANARPALADQGPEDDLGGDPLHDASVAAAATADTFDPLVPTHEQSAGLLHADVLDDLPFSFGESAPAAPWAPLETSSEAPALLLSDLDRTGPKSLVFNPDAGATPFSASVIDLLPSASHLATENDESGFTEFDLEPASSHDSSGPELGISAAKEYSFSAAAGAGPTGVIASTAPVAYEPPVFTPRTAIEPEYLAPAELESSTLDVLPLDRWLDGPEIAPIVVSSPSQNELGEPAEAITSEVAAPIHAAEAEVVSTSDAVQPLEDEDAKRRAFEELFNSTEPFPVEEFYAAAPTEVDGSSLPTLAELSEHHSGEVTPDTEIESLLYRDDEFIEPELDPYLMKKEDPSSAASEIPDRDPLLDDSFDTDYSAPVSFQPTPAATTDSGESYATDHQYVSPPDELSELIAPLPTPPLEVEPAAVQVDAVAALPLAPEALKPETLGKWAPSALAYMAGIVEAACEGLPAPLKSASDIEYPAAQQVAAEPIHSESELPQTGPALPETIPAMAMPEAQQAPMHADPDLPGSEPPPVQEPEPEPAPVKEPEPQPAPVPPELIPAELAAFQSDTPVAAISASPDLPPQLTENERISQAVDRVFDRFKRLLVTAIVRELARHD